MRAAPGTRQLVPISCGYIRRPRGWTGRRGGEAKGWGPRPARPLLSGAGFLIPTRRVRRCPGSRVGKRIPNREESGGRWKKGVARAPLTYLGAVAATAATRATGGVGARAHAPANSRSPSPGLPAAPLGFRGRRERNEKWPQQIRERRGNWAGARCPRGAAPGGGRHRARWVRTAKKDLAGSARSGWGGQEARPAALRWEGTREKVIVLQSVIVRALSCPVPPRDLTAAAPTMSGNAGEPRCYCGCLIGKAAFIFL